MLGLFILCLVFPAVLLLSAGLNRGYDWIKEKFRTVRQHRNGTRRNIQHHKHKSKAA